MDNKGLKRQYGLVTAMCMVIGSVIGSGVFFKAEVMLGVTNGNLPTALGAWLLGGIVMVISAYTFAIMGTKFEKVNGVVDYCEALVGKKYAYFVGWFMATIYYPAMTSALAWLSARYTMALFQGAGDAVTSAETMTLACFYLCASFALNTLSSKLAGKFQVSTTFIKLVPLALMAIVGTIVGLSKGNLSANMSTIVVDGVATARTGGLDFGMLISGVCTSVFAYEGWVIATSINSELKDSKKNLPRALVLGTVIVVIVYMLYYLGISGSIPTADLLANGAGLAFTTVFGNVAGTILTAFIAISCLGTLNGLTLGCGRGFYSLAARGQGPAPQFMSKIDTATNMPSNAGILALLFNAGWMFYFYIANLSALPAGASDFAKLFLFDSTELPLICVYAFYIPIYILLMVKAKELNVFKRIIMPILSIAGAGLFIYAAIVKHGVTNLGFLAVAAVIMIVGAFFAKPRSIED